MTLACGVSTCLSRVSSGLGSSRSSSSISRHGGSGGLHSNPGSSSGFATIVAPEDSIDDERDSVVVFVFVVAVHHCGWEGSAAIGCLGP